MEREYQYLKARWLDGDRDRELCLHLLFLAWWRWAEPDFLTGLNDDPDAPVLWHAVFLYMGGESSTDAEFLFTAGIMAKIFPWALGEHSEWEKRGGRMVAEAMKRRLIDLPPSTFDDKSEYGRYFSGQLRVTVP